MIVVAGCQLVPSPQPLDFGKVYVGTTSQTLTARWTNQHDQDDAAVLGLQMQGPYAILNGQAFTGLTVAPGQQTPAIQIQFSPTAVGSFPEEVRMAVQGPRAVTLNLRGEGVWQLFTGTLSLENGPVTILAGVPMGSTPLQPNQPIDWGTKVVGQSATEAEFLVRNAGPDMTGTASVRLLKGDQHFVITFPSTFAAMDIASNGTRTIRVQFTPDTAGEWLDVVEVTDTANPANTAGIVLKAKVVPGD
jgi:hypothetical protein